MFFSLSSTQLSESQLPIAAMNIVNMEGTFIYYSCLFNIVAKDLPGGKQSLVINMMAQYTTFGRAMGPVKI